MGEVQNNRFRKLNRCNGERLCQIKKCVMEFDSNRFVARLESILSLMNSTDCSRRQIDALCLEYVMKKLKIKELKIDTNPTGQLTAI